MEDHNNKSMMISEISNLIDQGYIKGEVFDGESRRYWWKLKERKDGFDIRINDLDK